MRKLVISSTLSLFVAGSALAQEPATSAEPTSTAAPVDAPPAEAPPAEATPTSKPPAVLEESFDASAFAGGSGGEGTMSAEELEELGFGGGSPAVDTDLKFFGFADMNFSFYPLPRNNPYRLASQPHSQFFIGNINLYLSKNLSESVRMMAEVRFHYAPHGSNAAGEVGAIVNEYGDPADFQRPVHLGGIEIERIYVEWAMHSLLAVRLGQFLTPYGIWNVDHGSPIYIPPTRPYVIGSALFPERQTGAEFLGRADTSTNNTIGYHFTLSNGMGPISEIRDLDENKGVGARLYWENRNLGVLRLGGSIFYAKDTAATTLGSLNSEGKLKFSEHIDTQSKVLAMAVDLQWRYRGWHLQAELITQQREFVSGGRHAATNPFTGQPLFPADYTSLGSYTLLGYGFDVHSVNLMPYVMVATLDELSAASLIKTRANSLNVGFNIRPIDPMVIKLSYQYATFPKGGIVSDNPLHSIQTQLAWAF